MTEYPTDGSGALDPVDNDDSSLDEEWWGDVSNPIDGIMEAAQGIAEAKANSNNGKIIPFPGAEAKKKSRQRENGASSRDKAAGAKKAGGLENAKSLEGSGGKVVPFPGGAGAKGAGAAGVVAAAGNVKSKWKQKGPMGAIIGLIITVGVAIFGAQAAAPFGFAANALDELNALRTSMNRRSNVMRKKQLTDDGTHRTLTKVGIFGEKFKISRKMEKRLGKQGITVEAEGGVKFLKYTDPESGQVLAVAATDADADALRSGGGLDADVNITALDDNGKIKVGSGASEKVRSASQGFSVAQDKSTRTVKGHIAGWFDKISSNFHARIGKNRNQHKDTGGDPDSDEVQQKVRDQVEESRSDRSFEDPDTQGNNQEEETVQVPDKSQTPSDDPCTGCLQADDGKYYPPKNETRRTTVSMGDGGLDETRARSQIDADDAAGVRNTGVGDADGAVGKALSSRARKAMQTGGEIVCMVSKAISAIAMVTMALQIMSIIDYTTQFMESIDNVKAGADTAALSMNMNQMATPGVTKGASGKIEREGTSGLSSPAWNAFFDGPMIDPNDEVAKTFNQEHLIENATERAMHSNNSDFQNSIGTILGKFAGVATGATTMLAAYKACAIGSMVVSVAGIVSDVVDIVGVIGGVATFGISTLVVAIKKVVVWLAKQIVQKLAVTAAMAVVGLIIPHIVNFVARLLVFNFMEDAEGELGAYALASGQNVYMGRNMQSSSGLPGTEDQVIAQWRETQAVIAEEAEFERATRSPFDITSKNTFLGSIAYALMPIGFAANQNTFGGIVSKTLSTTSTMVSSLTGTKIYADEVKIATNLNKDCPALQTLDLVGDAYCNPYYVTDMSTMEDDPADVIVAVCNKDKHSFKDNVCEKYVINGGTESDTYDEVPQINEDSEFGKWMVSCPMRTSQWGYVDEQIQSFIFNTGSATMDTVLNSGVGIIPVAGDAMEILQQASALDYLPWNTGQNCTKSEYNAFSRYSEDQRWMENEGMIDKAATAAFMEEYYEKNPIDDSLEGQIAMYSGLSKEHVDETLGVVEYAYHVFNYDPSERIAMYESEEPKYYYYESEGVVAEQEPALEAKRVVYFDLRGRTYTV